MVCRSSCNKKAPSGRYSQDMGVHEPETSSQVPGMPTDGFPPPYSVVDPNTRTAVSTVSLPAAVVQSDLKIVQKQPNSLEATKSFGIDRLLYVHTTNISTSSLIVEHDTDSTNHSSVVVTAEVSSQLSDINDRCTITMEPNDRGEYEVLVSFRWSLLNVFSTRCKFIVRVPALATIVHPGIRAEVCNDHYGMGHLPNINFSVLDVKAPNCNISLNIVNGQRITMCSTNGTIKAEYVQAAELLSLIAANKKLILTNSQSPDIHVQTTNNNIILESVNGDKVDAETSNSKLMCNNVTAGELRLKTTNAAIETNTIAADMLQLTTSNSSVKGTWLVKNKLGIHTSNSKIAGAIQLKDPRARASIDLKTSNASIDVSLPAQEFRGSFDAKTSNSSVGVEWMGEAVAKEPPIRYIVDTKSYKRGSVGPSIEFMHDLVANTSNSSLSIKFVDKI
ncbi:hypothetical protein IW147_005176 [Coemansia sp. RSA 720]|nr:hypothetical protein IW147_005176 [Coemansia sp. RSA 720]KAJ2543726.1 hypothetical protein GGF49_001808 [Coemansia sp. RSA 1853]